MIKNSILYVILFLLILLTACWDSINIEERGFIIGTAIDTVEETGEKNPEFSVTNQVVVPAGMASPSNQNGGEQAFLNFTSKGNSIYKIDEEVAALSSKVPYYEHLTILIISEDTARKKHLFSKLLDTYIRDVNFRRGIKAIVAKGDAKEMLEFVTPEDKLPAMYIEELLEDSSKQVGILKPKSVGDIEEAHLEASSFVLPYLQVKEFMEYKHGAVFHGPEDKMVGVLQPEDMQGLEMIRGEHQTKIIDFEYDGETSALKAIRSKSNMTVDPNNLDKIQVTIDIQIEGIIKETFNQTDLTKTTEISDVRKAISNKIKKTVEKSIEKGQGELGTDVFGIWQELKTKHYDTWIQVKEDWEKGEYYFKNVDFDVHVTTEIYSVGTTNKTK